MQTIYPLKPIITHEQALAAYYNAAPDSVIRLSACMTPEQAGDLLAQGASFQTLIFVNQAGTDLLSTLGDQSDWDNELMPQIQHYTYSPTTSPDDAMNALHALMHTDMAMHGMG